MEPTVYFHCDYSEYGFAENAAVHLRCSEFAVNEDDRHLDDFKSGFVGCEFHFNLEGVSFEAYLIQIDGFQHLAAVTYETGGGVVDGNACDDTHILGSEIRHQYPPHRPIDHVYAAYVA